MSVGVQGLKEKKLVQSNLDKVDALKPIAKELGCTMAQLALAWCVKNEHVSTVITGATKPEQASVGCTSQAFLFIRFIPGVPAHVARCAAFL